MQILIADDKLDVVNTVSAILQNEGYKIAQAFNGQECLDTAELVSPKLCILDIMMPDMSGYQVAEELRNKYSNNIKIVYMSIKPKSEVVMDHADDFISKPFDIKDIINTTKKLLK